MVEGLEIVHRPITEMFDFPRPADLRGFELTPEQIGDFRRDGFVSGIRVLSPLQVSELAERLEKIRADLDRFRDRLYEVEAGYLNRPEQVVCHLLGAWRVDTLFHDLIFAPPVTIPAAQLLGVRRVRFWHDQVFYKPPRHPGVVPWHQDYSYWTRSTPPNHITVNILLDDANLENGALQYVPGSHRWPLLPKVALDGPMEALLDHVPTDQRRLFLPVASLGRAGEASFHHAFTVHGSYGNRSGGPRRAIVLNYMGPETLCADGERPLLEGSPPIPAGSVIQGPFFPIVLDRGA